MSNVTATVTFLTGESQTFSDVIGFTYTKDRYSPTVYFFGRFITEAPVAQISAGTVSINGKTVITGYAEKAVTERTASGYVLSLTIKSYSSLLEQNHIQPGMYTGLSLSGLYTNYVNINGVSFQNSSTQVNYANFTDNASLWEAAAHLCLRLYDVFPFVLFNNQLRFTVPSNSANINLSSSEIVSADESFDTSRLISRIYMKDINGNYAAYNKACPYTQSLGIVREKHIGTLHSWLFDVNSGLEYKLNMARRKTHTKSFSYNGYKGEDLYASASVSQNVFGPAQSFNVHAIKIVGTDKKITTTLSCYDDYYSNMERG